MLGSHWSTYLSLSQEQFTILKDNWEIKEKNNFYTYLPKMELSNMYEEKGKQLNIVKCTT